MLRIMVIALSLLAAVPLFAIESGRSQQKVASERGKRIQKRGHSGGSIHGKIRTKNGKTMDGVQVLVNGYSIGGVSRDGHYHVEGVPAGKQKITFSMTGYRTRTLNVNVVKGKEISMDISLQETVIDMNPLVVTGTRTIKNRLDSPVTVDIVPTENFEIESATNLAEGLNMTTGVRVENNCQNCNFTQLRMNGLDGAYSRLLINGESSVSSLAGVYILEQLPASMIDRVEVVKGGGSALYGGSAVGGVVNVITRKPEIEQTRLGMRYGWIDGKPDRTATLSTSVISDDRSIGAVLVGQSKQRNPVDLNEDGFSELGILKQTSFGGNMIYNPSEKMELLADLFFMQEERRGGDKITSSQPHEAEIAEAVETRRISGKLELDYTHSARTEYNFFATFANTERDSYYGGGQDPNAYGNTLNPLYIIGGHVNHKLSLAHYLTSGLELESDGLKDVNQSYNRTIDNTYNTFGAFVQDDWQAAPWLNLVLGARFDRHSEIDGFIISPRLTAMVKASENTSVRAAVSTGYRPPVVFDEDLHIAIVGGEGRIIENSPDLEEENSISVSGGLEHTRQIGDHGSGLFLSTNGFYTVLNDAFGEVFSGRSEGDWPVWTRINEGKAFVYGFEFQVGYSWRNRLTMRTGWTVQESRFDHEFDISADESEVIMTDQFLRTPNIYGYITSSYSIIPGTLDMDVNLDFTGPMAVLNESSNVFKPETDWFTTIDTRVTWTVGGTSFLKLFVHGMNLTNSYQKDLDTGPERDSAYVYGPQRPRSFYMGVETGF